MEGNWREFDDGAEGSQEGRFSCGRPANMSMRFLTWLYLTCAIALIGFVLGSVKPVLSHYTSPQPIPHVRMFSLRSTGLLVSGALLLSGLGWRGRGQPHRGERRLDYRRERPLPP